MGMRCRRVEGYGTYRVERDRCHGAQRVSPIDKLTATPHVVEMPLEEGPRESLSVLFVQLSIILDRAIIAAGITKPSDTVNVVPQQGGGGTKQGYTFYRGSEKVLFLGLGIAVVLRAGCVLLARVGHERGLGLGFSSLKFSDTNIATRPTPR